MSYRLVGCFADSGHHQKSLTWGHLHRVCANSHGLRLSRKSLPDTCGATYHRLSPTYSPAIGVLGSNYYSRPSSSSGHVTVAYGNNYGPAFPLAYVFCHYGPSNKRPYGMRVGSYFCQRSNTLDFLAVYGDTKYGRRWSDMYQCVTYGATYPLWSYTCCRHVADCDNTCHCRPSNSFCPHTGPYGGN